MFVLVPVNVIDSSIATAFQMLEIEEEHIKSLCADLIALRPDLIITEKGVSDLAQHYLVKAGITCLRRVKKTDNNRLARACGATIVNRTEELKEEDVGTGAGLFEVKKVLTSLVMREHSVVKFITFIIIYSLVILLQYCVMIV